MRLVKTPGPLSSAVPAAMSLCSLNSPVAELLSQERQVMPLIHNSTKDTDRKF